MTLETQPPPPTKSLAHELEDGPLRRELGLPPAPPPPSPLPTAHVQHLVFSGRGSEYFRIWVVGALLTLLTFGIYSAWAKVRKARWFAQHTLLDGDRFDYHGDPLRVLAGRVVALLLLLLWSWGFEFSLWLGMAVLALFCVCGPLLFASAQRFRLANTSWRGLRFGFEVPRAKVYAVCVPLLLLWAAGSVAQSAGVEGALFVAAGLVPLLGLPWAHARLKQLQHGHASFGDQRFGLQPSTPEFYGLYAKALVLLIVGGVMVGLAAAAVAAVRTSRLNVGGWSDESMLWPLLAAIGSVLLLWMMAWPYFAARLQQIVWGRTRCGALWFSGEMRGAHLWRLVLVNTALVLVTAGLYWPFAAVAIARYRVQSIAVHSDMRLAEVQAGAAPRGEQRSAGDGAADFFGLDLGW